MGNSARKEKYFSPLRGLLGTWRRTHGLRRGLHSFAPSELGGRAVLGTCADLHIVFVTVVTEPNGWEWRIGGIRGEEKRVSYIGKHLASFDLLHAGTAAAHSGGVSGRSVCLPRRDHPRDACDGINR